MEQMFLKCVWPDMLLLPGAGSQGFGGGAADERASLCGVRHVLLVTGDAPRLASNAVDGSSYAFCILMRRRLLALASSVMCVARSRKVTGCPEVTLDGA
jgi:hypothetical protein